MKYYEITKLETPDFKQKTLVEWDALTEGEKSKYETMIKKKDNG